MLCSLLIQIQFPAVFSRVELPGHADEGPGGDCGGVARTHIHATHRIIIRAPPSKMREPYSNHFVRLSVRPSVRLSVCPHFLCNAITQKVFDLETSYFIHRWRIKKGRHL